MKTLLTGLMAVGLLAAPALADGMDNATGNTVRVIVDDAGNGFDAYFDADGGYSDSLGRTGATWTWADNQLCIVPPAEAAAQGSGPNCGPWDGTLAVGSSTTSSEWSQDGTEITISIIEGRGHTAPTPPAPPSPPTE